MIEDRLISKNPAEVLDYHLANLKETGSIPPDYVLPRRFRNALLGTILRFMLDRREKEPYRLEDIISNVIMSSVLGYIAGQIDSGDTI